MNPPIAERDKWLAFDYSKTLPVNDEGYTYCEMFNVVVSNDAEGGNSERTEITFDTEQGGGNDMQVVIETHEYGRGPQTYVLESKRFTVTLYGGIESSGFFEAMRRLVRAYDLRTKIGD